MAKQTFSVGQVLTAAQVTALQTNEYNQTVNSKTTSYTLVATDVGTRISMNSASSTTITVNTSLFNAGDQVYVVNIGAGVTTITAGTATVTTSGSLALAQYDSGTLYFTATGSAIFFSASASGDVTLTGTQTLTNKTLTAPVVTYSINAQTTTAYVTVAADVGAFITVSNASANTFKIPTNASVAYAIGSTIQVMNIGAGATTISAVTSGTTTITSAGAVSASPTLAQYKAAQCIKTGTDTWLVFGAIA
jgi:hypothetical protein